jgi:hypothetical protein
VIIARRFRGPPESGNGGYVCGALGTLLPVPAEVTLKIPPPLEQELEVDRLPDGSARLRAGEAIVATAAPAQVDLEPPAKVSFDDAVKASRRFPWVHTHPWPSCFVCGTARSEDGGLQIFCGAVEGRSIAAGPWFPDASLADQSGRVRPEIVWAALDCPSWFGMACFQEWEGLAVLGRLAARVDGLPRAGERCVCTGWFLGREGRKLRTASALYGEGGALLAVGKSTWVFLK